jgi:hypothetical protein
VRKSCELARVCKKIMLKKTGFSLWRGKVGSLHVPTGKPWRKEPVSLQMSGKGGTCTTGKYRRFHNKWRRKPRKLVCQTVTGNNQFHSTFGEVVKCACLPKTLLAEKCAPEKSEFIFQNYGGKTNIL